MRRPASEHSVVDRLLYSVQQASIGGGILLQRGSANLFKEGESRIAMCRIAFLVIQTLWKRRKIYEQPVASSSWLCLESYGLASCITVSRIKFNYFRLLINYIKQS